MPTPIKVHFVAGDRGGGKTSQSQIPRESNELRESLEELKPKVHPATVDFVNNQATSRSKFTKLLEQNPTILHFAGHGEERALLFLNSRDQTDPMSEDELIEVFQIVGRTLEENEDKNNLRLIVLNCCDSGRLARRLVEEAGIPFAIGTEGKLSDDLARAFTQNFYRRLADGPLKEVFRLSSINARMDKEKTQLFTGNGHDADCLLLKPAQSPKQDRLRRELLLYLKLIKNEAISLLFARPRKVVSPIRFTCFVASNNAFESSTIQFGTKIAARKNSITWGRGRSKIYC